MNRKFIIIIVLAGMAGILFYTFRSHTPKKDISYREKIETERQEKDESFKTDDDSPLTDDQKTTFTHLQYFPVNEKYRIKADFEKNNREQTITMNTSTEEDRQYLVYGKVHFHLDGKELNLTIYKPVDMDEEYFFLPFFDATSAETTYGSGRYLDPEIKGGTAILDFNEAYNPYCAYNHNYSCPIPPRENYLSTPILAGEKLPDFEH